jgi:hypothetical protein
MLKALMEKRTRNEMPDADGKDCHINTIVVLIINSFLIFRDLIDHVYEQFHRYCFLANFALPILRMVLPYSTLFIMVD